MKVFNTHSEIRQFLKKERCNGSKIGLVPTMGALHQGHLSLIQQSISNGDFSVASIFVNPTQFNKPEDLEKYPRNQQRDLEMLKTAGCQAVFLPSVEEMYPHKVNLSINFGSLESELEGRFRPGHFAGVGLVVSKLFNMIQPDNAYFGQKDLQQYYIIKQLVDQLSFPIALHMAPIIRETHGLAMSSRNERLSDNDRLQAGTIYKALTEAKKILVKDGKIAEAKGLVNELFESAPRLTLEYFEAIDTRSFKPLETIGESVHVALCIAAEIGQVRLIDNVLLIS